MKYVAKCDANAAQNIDKTELIKYTNSVMHTTRKCICVSRPRRFGKSITANMLAAYYSRGCNSRNLFEHYKIAKEKSFLKFMNQYDTVSLNMQEFLSRSGSMEQMLERMRKAVVRELSKSYPEVDYFDEENLASCMQDVYKESRVPFVVIIDEWDCVFREYKQDKEAQKQYLDFLRDLLKDKGYIYLAYMTGILPIKKYGTHSALNMFDEFSMINPMQLAEYVGFTEKEVSELCERYGRKLEEIKEWYNGYRFPYETAVYNPRSVIAAVTSGICDSYWNQTETFEALKMYIDMNFEGLKDDVLTLLIHLGYLAYDTDMKEVYIPNNEIRGEFKKSCKHWKVNNCNAICKLL